MDIVSAIICTRGRPDSLARAVQSLLADKGAFELIVIDQSVDAATERVLAPFGSDPRLRYIRSTARGKGAALNEGLHHARGEIVVCTDDDCEAAGDWIIGMARVLEAESTAAIVFCNVTAAPYDSTTGYIPAFERRDDRLLRSIADSRQGLGLGAGMALRRSVVLELGGFDETFGPGARFPSGDDWDIARRALVSGWHVSEAAHVSILHHGFRTLAQGSEHARRDWLAIGALAAKPVRARDFRSITVTFAFAAKYALWPPLRDLLRLRRPSGLARIVGFSHGFVQGMRMPMDRKTLLYRPAD